MLITESQMGFCNKFTAIDLLSSMNYLSEAESVFSPALVPIVENSNVGANLIRLEDIISFAESNGIEDLGYALTCVCEASQVEPSTIAFTVQEENVIADDSLAELVSGIMQEGVTVIAKPLNENNPMGILTDYAVESFIESGDDVYLEALCHDPIALAETAITEASKSNLSRLQDIRTQLRAADPKMGSAFDADLQKAGGRQGISNSKAEALISTWSNRLGQKKSTPAASASGGSNLTPEQQALKDRLKTKHKPAVASGKAGNPEKFAAANKMPEEAPAPAAAPAAAAGGAPADPKKAESFLDKVKNYANKGRDAIAAVIAKLHKWAAGINYRIQNDPEKKGIWSTIKQKITAAIQFLTAKLHNAVAANRTDLAAKASEYNDAANTLD